MNFKIVRLTDGSEIKVFPPPSIKIEAILDKKFPMPEVPSVTDKTASGKEVTMEIDDDPVYLAKVKEVEGLRQEERNKLHFLFALREVEPPTDFDLDVLMGDVIRYSDPSWEPRTDKVGRRQDYIEWIILGDMVNATRVQQALGALLSIDLEVVSQVEESF